jgi:HK97 gp10 family phage protein
MAGAIYGHGIELLGEDEVDLKLGLILERCTNGNLKNALMEGGKIIETACKSFCPVGKYPAGSGRVGGRLRSSIITTGESEDSVYVAPHTDYATYVEFGTYKMQAQPYMGPGFESSRQAAIDHIRKKLGDAGASIGVAVGP